MSQRRRLHDPTEGARYACESRLFRPRCVQYGRGEYTSLEACRKTCEEPRFGSAFATRGVASFLGDADTKALAGTAHLPLSVLRGDADDLYQQRAARSLLAMNAVGHERDDIQLLRETLPALVALPIAAIDPRTVDHLLDRTMAECWECPWTLDDLETIWSLVLERVPAYPPYDVLQHAVYAAAGAIRESSRAVERIGELAKAATASGALSQQVSELAQEVLSAEKEHEKLTDTVFRWLANETTRRANRLAPADPALAVTAWQKNASEIFSDNAVPEQAMLLRNLVSPTPLQRYLPIPLQQELDIELQSRLVDALPDAARVLTGYRSPADLFRSAWYLHEMNAAEDADTIIAAWRSWVQRSSLGDKDAEAMMDAAYRGVRAIALLRDEELPKDSQIPAQLVLIFADTEPHLAERLARDLLDAGLARGSGNLPGDVAVGRAEAYGDNFDPTTRAGCPLLHVRDTPVTAVPIRLSREALGTLAGRDPAWWRANLAKLGMGAATPSLVAVAPDLPVHCLTALFTRPGS